MEQVASRLRLTQAQINAIEADDFGVFPGAVFSRGYVTNYARLVGIDAAPLLAVMTQTATSVSTWADARLMRDATGVVMNPPRRRGLSLAVLACVGVMGALALYEFVLKETPGGTPQLANAPQTSIAVRSAPDTGASSESLARNDQQYVDARPEVGKPAGETTANSASVKRGLHFMFNRESWVEVRDGVGNILFSRVNSAGTEQVVEGNPPFKLIVGGVGGVQLDYNGSPVNLAAYATEDVARLRLE